MREPNAVAKSAGSVDVEPDLQADADDTVARDVDSSVADQPARARRPATSWLAVGIAVACAAALVLRFMALSHLWLDEALTVNISKLPLSKIPDALRHDGSPPAYYVMLHFWMKVFGESPFAVRALSGVFSVVALPLMWIAGRRVGGRRVAVIATMLLVASPFAIRQATETRMYSFLVVVTLVGFLALSDLLRKWSWSRGAALALATGAAMLTHYWSFYLIAVTGLFLAWRSLKGAPDQQPLARRALASMAAGAALFIPWLPAFLYQTGHTGTPWGAAATPRWILDTVFQFVDGHNDYGMVLGLAFYGLIGLAVFARPVDGHRIELDFRGRDPGRLMAVLTFGALTLAIAAAMITRSAYAPRYAAVIFPLMILLVAMGTGVLLDTRVQATVVALCVAFGIIAQAPESFGERTQAAKVAAALNATAQPGDVVAFCPDQIGPSVDILLHQRGVQLLTFPAATSPERVDWVNYAARNAAGKTLPFAQMLAQRAGPDHDVWVVWSPGYLTYKAKCEALVSDMEKVRPNISRPVKLGGKYFEKAGLVRYQTGPAATVTTPS